MPPPSPPVFFNLPTPDRLIRTFDRALRTLALPPRAARPTPADAVAEPALSETERRHAAGLMRINHTGEICAQGLYLAQALVARDPQVRERLAQSAREEEDHLAWTRERLGELNARPSLLDPFWLAGSIFIGVVAGARSDAHSLGFVAECEHQVESHLSDHLNGTASPPLTPLPAQDYKSRTIVEQMRVDEARHALHAEQLGAAPVPPPGRWLMRALAQAMKTVVYRI